MTGKKRLEDIKTWLNRGFDLTEEDIDWLIEQAGRVQELEEDLTKYRNGFEIVLLINNSIKKQNKRYREALSIISANLPLDGREHYVDIARQALEGEE